MSEMLAGVRILVPPANQGAQTMQKKLGVTILTAILAVALATAASAVGGSAGTLDPTFGNGGTVMTSFGQLTEEGHAVVVQPDGRIVAGGLSSGPTADFALARYLPDGQPDSSFGNGGKVLTPFPGEFTFINALLLQP